jgi:branched-chain amino acid transport system substrate-binding protein
MRNLSICKAGFILMLVAAIGFMGPSMAIAADKIKLGVVYPITGPLTNTGKLYVEAYRLYVDMINNSYDIDSPGNIIRSKGLPNLGGAQVELAIADSEGKPDVGRSEAERLITVEKVDVMMGAFQSAVTDTTSQVTERYGMPYVNPASSSPKLTNRGFKWFFRTGPDEWSYVGSIMDFLKQFSERHRDLTIKNIAVVTEDTLWGQDSTMVVKERAPKLGFNVVVEISYPHEATDVEAEVLRVKRANPDVIIMASYIADALLFQKNFKKYDVSVPIVANGTGHIRPQFVQTLGSDVNYVMARQTWADIIIEGNPIAKQVNQALKSRYGAGSGLTDIAARTYVGFMTLMDAINRAGSKDPRAIQKALTETDIPGNFLALPWDGVKFDPKTHQNIYSRVMIIQYQNKVQKVVWPWSMAEAEVVWKLPPWDKR